MLRLIWIAHRAVKALAIGLLAGLIVLSGALEGTNTVRSIFAPVALARQAQHQIVLMDVQQQMLNDAPLGAADETVDLLDVPARIAQLPQSRIQALRPGLGLPASRALAEMDADNLRLLSDGSTNAFAFESDQPLAFDVENLDQFPVAEGGDDWKCLTEALYFEARGETLMGQMAVAEVILNRADSRSFPNTVCKVVSQGANGSGGCQFSFKCDGRADVMHERQAKGRVAKIARLMLDGRRRLLTGGAVYYHTNYVTPGWSRRMERTAEIGVHRFYRPLDVVAQN